MGDVDSGAVIPVRGELGEAHVPCGGVEIYSLSRWRVHAGLRSPATLACGNPPGVILAARDIDRHALLRKIDGGANGRRAGGAGEKCHATDDR